MQNSPHTVILPYGAYGVKKLCFFMQHHPDRIKTDSIGQADVALQLRVLRLDKQGEEPCHSRESVNLCEYAQ